MAGTAVRGRLTWQTATVGTVMDETPQVRTLSLSVPDWPGHRAGQHVDIRLTADDGYQAERAYSIASAPGEPLAITVERLDDGEVSPYLTQDTQPGDEFEVRGPVGGYFVWEPDTGGPLLLAAGGSGVVPLRAILRQRARTGSTVPVKLLYSSRSWEDVIYSSELDFPADGVEVTYTLTRFFSGTKFLDPGVVQSARVASRRRIRARHSLRKTRARRGGPRRARSSGPARGGR